MGGHWLISLQDNPLLEQCVQNAQLAIMENIGKHLALRAGAWYQEASNVSCKSNMKDHVTCVKFSMTWMQGISGQSSNVAKFVGRVGRPKNLFKGLKQTNICIRKIDNVSKK